MIRKAVIPAAGFGTRFLPATKAQPKEMLPVVDTPVIQYVVNEAVQSGITDIIIVIGRGKRAIEEHFDRSLELETQLEKSGKTQTLASIRQISEMADIHFVWQREMRGLGDAVYCARHHVGDEPFAVLLGDTIIESATNVPVTRQLADIHDAHDAPVIAFQEVPREQVSRYGIAKGSKPRNGIMRLTDLIEKPGIDEAPSNLAVSARYILTPEIFGFIADTKRGKNNEIQLTDAIRSLLQTRPAYGLQFQGKRYDVGNKTDFITTNIDFALRDPDMRDELVAYIRQLATTL
jgi:UTP--glucose-1-phosphate uridylyltransferase